MCWLNPAPIFVMRRTGDEGATQLYAQNIQLHVCVVGERIKFMRKRIVPQAAVHTESGSPENWLDLEPIATVEVTSEDPDFPIESVFRSGGPGWRALENGKQQIRLIFDQPISLNHVRLRFIETELERTQEFTLRWSSAQGGLSKEIVRQQWHFSPAGSTTELEDYQTSLDGVVVLELAIQPDLERRGARATLAEWRIA